MLVAGVVAGFGEECEFVLVVQPDSELFQKWHKGNRGLEGLKIRFSASLIISGNLPQFPKKVSRWPAMPTFLDSVGTNKFGTIRDNFQAVLDRAGHGKHVVCWRSR